MRSSSRLFGPRLALAAGRASTLLALASCALGASFVGCGEGAPLPTTGSVVIGLTSEFRVPVDMVQLSFVASVNGEEVSNEVRGVTQGMTPLSFPFEIPFDNLQGGDVVSVKVEGFGGGGAVLFPLVTRLASTEVVAGRKLLMRVPLEVECAPGPKTPVCDAPETCITGVCRDSHKSPMSLQLYNPAWSSPSGDICKPAGAGDPIVIVGYGQSDYLSMEDGEVRQVEAGPQGGHHIWVALRMKNLAQSGSITTVEGYVPDLKLELSPFNVIFTFNQDEGGYCELHGLRYQLDGDGVDIETLLGHQVQVKVTVTETATAAKAIGTGERLVTLSDTIL